MNFRKSAILAGIAILGCIGSSWGADFPNKPIKILLGAYGSPTGFFTRPISAVSLGLALFLIGSNFMPYLRKKRQEIPRDESE